MLMCSLDAVHMSAHGMHMPCLWDSRCWSFVHHRWYKTRRADGSGTRSSSHCELRMSLPAVASVGDACNCRCQSSNGAIAFLLTGICHVCRYNDGHVFFKVSYK